MKLHRFFLAVCICALASGVSACWAPLSLERLVENSPTVIVGKIERVGFALPSERSCGTAYIKVSKVLKNTAKNIEVTQGKEVPLSIPALVNLRELRTTKYATGTEGVWFLFQKEKSSTFWIFAQTGVQPLAEEPNITAIIAKPPVEMP
jgi:hypothetical protein